MESMKQRIQQKIIKQIPQPQLQQPFNILIDIICNEMADLMKKKDDEIESLKQRIQKLETPQNIKFDGSSSQKLKQSKMEKELPSMNMHMKNDGRTLDKVTVIIQQNNVLNGITLNHQSIEKILQHKNASSPEEKQEQAEKKQDQYEPIQTINQTSNDLHFINQSSFPQIFKDQDKEFENIYSKLQIEKKTILSQAQNLQASNAIQQTQKKQLIPLNKQKDNRNIMKTAQQLKNNFPLDLMLQMASISVIEQKQQNLNEEEKKIKLHQQIEIFQMVLKWKHLYHWINNFQLQKFHYQLDFTYIVEKILEKPQKPQQKYSLESLKSEITKFLEQYLEHQHQLKSIFIVQRITITNLVNIQQTKQLLEVNWSGLQHVVIQDSDNWFLWMKGLNRFESILFGHKHNLKKIQIHVDFLFPQYMQTLSKYSRHVYLQIHIMYMTKQTYFELQSTKFYSPQRISVIFFDREELYSQTLDASQDDSIINLNIEILQDLHDERPFNFDNLIQLDMTTFYDKCSQLKAEYDASFDLFSLVDKQPEMDLQYAKQLSTKNYHPRKNKKFTMNMFYEMKLQKLLTNFQWSEVDIFSSVYYLAKSEWQAFIQNSQKFPNLTIINLDQELLFSFLQIKAEDLMKFKNLKHLIISECFFESRTIMSMITNNSVQSREIRYENLQKSQKQKMIKHAYYLSVALKQKNVQVLIRNEYKQFEDKTDYPDLFINQAFKSFEEMEKFYIQTLDFNNQMNQINQMDQMDQLD